MKSFYFLLLTIITLSSCQSQPIENQKSYPTETHEILESFYPELKAFYVKNGFCNVDDDISIGNRNLMLHLSEQQNFDSLKDSEIHDSTCQKMQETDIYNTIWEMNIHQYNNFDNDSVLASGNIKRNVSITIITKQDSDYNKWLNSNYTNFQPFLESWYWTKSELPSRASYHFLIREKSELDSIDYTDKMFTNTILTEFLIPYLDNVCPFETIKFDESQITKSHKIINSFLPELRQFYIKNDFCKIEDDIAVGNRNFITHISKHKDYQYLEPFTIEDSTCKKIAETNIYLEIWNIDTMEVIIGNLDGEVKDTLHEKNFHVDTDYYKWILSNYKNLQPMLQNWFYTRLIEHRNIKSKHFLMYSEYQLAKIDYKDEMLTNTIIIEFLIRHLYLNCE